MQNEKRAIPIRKIAIIQARSTSTRLPGKCLLQLLGKTVLEHILDRLKRVPSLDSICVATTENTVDDAIVKVAGQASVSVYRGSEQDVLDRFYQAARQEQADVICRITSDDPLKDSGVTEKVMQEFLNNECDYASNTLHPTYPEGIDVEVFSYAALKKAWENGRLPSEREHVTPYIWKHPDKFSLLSVENSQDLSKLRWTLDYAEDWVFIQQVYEYLYPINKAFLMDDVLKLLEERPQLKTINAGIMRNEGYMKSLQADKDGKKL